jgi:DNA-binding response OmpR family regulator
MSPETLAPDYSVRIGRLEVDLRHKLGLKPDGEIVHLTKADLEILCALSVSEHQPMKAEQLSWLCNNLRGPAFSDGTSFVDAESIKKRIFELRFRLGENPHAPQFIETVWGFGYRLISPKIPDV